MPKYTIAHGEQRHDVNPDGVDLVHLSANTYHLLHEGHSYRCELESLNLPNKRLTVRVNGQRFELSIEDEIDALVRELGLEVVDSSATKDVHAPMPGLVLDVLVKAGETVNAGDRLLVLEAMKMENSLTAEGEGTITTVHVTKGDAVDKRQLLIEIA